MITNKEMKWKIRSATINHEYSKIHHDCKKVVKIGTMNRIVLRERSKTRNKTYIKLQIERVIGHTKISETTKLTLQL